MERTSIFRISQMRPMTPSVHFEPPARTVTMTRVITPADPTYPIAVGNIGPQTPDHGILEAPARNVGITGSAQVGFASPMVYPGGGLS